MAIQKIEIEFNTDDGRMMVGAQMDNQAQKDQTVRMLLSAIKIVVDFQKPVIEAARTMPTIPLLGKIPLKVTTH